ncbi:MAG: hypothetical protein AAFP99_12505 [Pseudomonadota bacterium]
MLRVFYIAVLAIIAAAVVHLAIVLLLPSTSPTTPWRVIADAVDANANAPADLKMLEARQDVDFGLDPAFAHLVCRYDLSSGPMRITGTGDVQLWTFVVITPDGEALFSANDRISPVEGIDVTVLNRTQLRTFRQAPPDELANTIVVPTETDEGYIVVRLFQPDESWSAIADTFAQQIACSRAALAG